MLTETSWTRATNAEADSSTLAGPSSTSRPYRIVACGAEDAARPSAEAFVRDAFYRTHRARIATFMPTLLLLTDASGMLRGVAGCRVAQTEPLFLERYLPRPIEEMIADRVRARAQRARIVEIGNFACSGSRLARRFISLLPYFLLSRQLDWVTFTATAPVRRILQHVGARCVELGAAEGACARDGADDWGRYYTHDPRVMAGYLPLARKIPTLLDAAYAD